MLVVEIIARIRREHFVKGKTIKEIARDLGISRNTIRKVSRSGETSFEYERTVQPRPKLGRWTADLNELLDIDQHHCQLLAAHGIHVATKAAVEAMTHTLAKELGPRGVTVNAVAPGPIAAKLLLTTRSQEVIQGSVKDIPLGRLGQPDDIAHVVSFLASPTSGWGNGQVIKANGGCS
jgi:NAD(P)-dependent dehydrogenase (short-subunit alcohol dehydrogenase family)